MCLLSCSGFNEDTLDEGENRIHVVVAYGNGSLTEITEVPSKFRTPSEFQPWSCECAVPGRVWITYCSNQTLTVYLDPQGLEKHHVLTETVDLSSIFDGDQVYIGFSAGTGGATDFHDVTSFQFSEDDCV